jgi:transcriptional regulator with XRE-family HTH domain
MIQRLKQFIEYKGVSVRKFCQICGITPSTIQTAITKNTSISTDKVELIAQNFRDLNMNWLFLGVGSMINEQNFDHIEPSSKAQKNTKIDENTNILVLELVRQIKELTAENAVLKSRLGDGIK